MPMGGIFQPFILIWNAIRSFFLRCLGKEDSKKIDDPSGGLVDLERADGGGGISKPGRYSSNTDAGQFMNQRRSSAGPQHNYMTDYQQQNLVKRKIC